MMNLPVLQPMAPRLLTLLEADSPKIAQVSDSGAPFSFICPLLYTPDGKVLLLGLEQERTQAGRGMVEALWFDKPVVLWLSGGPQACRLTTRPWQCHITGERFRQALDRFRQAHPHGDLLAVWELHPLCWEETEQRPPKPQTPSLLFEAESHLERLQPKQTPHPGE